MNSEIKIPLRKNKIFLLILGALAFVIFGIWFITGPERFASLLYRPRSVDFIKIAGIVGVAFLGICCFYIFQKLFDKKYGLMFQIPNIILDLKKVELEKLR